MTGFLYLRQLLEKRLERRAREWFRDTSAEIANQVTDARFCNLLSLASRQVGSAPLAPSEDELQGAERVMEGWNPERWTILEALRVGLVLARTDLADDSAVCALEEVFRYADEGELVALYRCLALLPEPERLLWRAGEGCRTNMRSVFEAAALDTPYPVRYFDDGRWRQAVIKCVFLEAPLWRMWGLDARLSEELARMALDLADERRSAHRAVQTELWLCLGPHGGERALRSMLKEVDPRNPERVARRAAAFALGRAGQKQLLEELCQSEEDPLVAGTMRDAIEHEITQLRFRDLLPGR
jgi:hypothetical protein